MFNKVLTMSQMSLQFTEDQRAKSRSKADEVLRLLQQGPASRNELLRLSHRFSTSIHQLREKGHVIDIESREKGNDVYHWRRYTPMVEVTESMKSCYYQTQHWKNTRLQRLALDGYRCCHCRSTTAIQVHHWHYELFSEDLADLTTLCEVCHMKIHENTNVTIHFPRFVTPDIAARMTCEKDR